MQNADYCIKIVDGGVKVYDAHENSTLEFKTLTEALACIDETEANS